MFDKIHYHAQITVASRKFHSQMKLADLDVIKGVGGIKKCSEVQLNASAAPGAWLQCGLPARPVT